MQRGETFSSTSGPMIAEPDLGNIALYIDGNFHDQVARDASRKRRPRTIGSHARLSFRQYSSVLQGSCLDPMCRGRRFRLASRAT